MAWLAQTEPFRLFWHPLPLWDAWYWLLLPLCIGVSIVYKAIKCRHTRQVPREASIIFIMIVVVMVLAAAGLMLLMKFLQRH